MFAKTLTVRTLAPLADPGEVFGGLPAVDGWHQDGPAAYVLAVSDAAVAAPAVTRALVAAGADVLSISESHHSLEDVYLELIDQDAGGGPRMRVNSRRVRAIVPQGAARVPAQPCFIVWTMAIFPLIFLIQPLVVVFTLIRVDVDPLSHEHLLLYMLGIPALVPPAVAAYVGGRRAPAGHARAGAHHADPPRGVAAGQGSGRAGPIGRVAYAVYALFLACVELFAATGRGIRAHPWPGPARPAVLHAADRRLVDLDRHRDLRPIERHPRRTAARILASLPTAVVTTLVAFNVIHATLGLAVGLAAALLLGNGLGWRISSAMFDRERLLDQHQVMRSCCPSALSASMAGLTQARAPACPGSDDCARGDEAPTA